MNKYEQELYEFITQGAIGAAMQRGLQSMNAAKDRFMNRGEGSTNRNQAEQGLAKEFFSFLGLRKLGKSAFTMQTALAAWTAQRGWLPTEATMKALVNMAIRIDPTFRSRFQYYSNSGGKQKQKQSDSSQTPPEQPREPVQPTQPTQQESFLQAVRVLMENEGDPFDVADPEDDGPKSFSSMSRQEKWNFLLPVLPSKVQMSRPFFDKLVELVADDMIQQKVITFGKDKSKPEEVVDSKMLEFDRNDAVSKSGTTFDMVAIVRTFKRVPEGEALLAKLAYLGKMAGTPRQVKTYLFKDAEVTRMWASFLAIFSNGMNFKNSERRGMQLKGPNDEWIAARGLEITLNRTNFTEEQLVWFNNSGDDQSSIDQIKRRFAAPDAKLNDESLRLLLACICMHLHTPNAKNPIQGDE